MAFQENQTAKPSLINPDFSGLYATAWLGHDQQWWSKWIGGFVMSLYLYSWIGGFVVPFVILYLFIFTNYYTTAVVLSSIAFLPYLIPIPASPMVCRFYMEYGAHWFDGGCSQSVEAKPKLPRIPNQPILATCHPHGILCIGFFMAAGLRFRAIQNVKNKKMRNKFAIPLEELGITENVICYRGGVVHYLAVAPLFNLIVTKLTGCIYSAANKNMKRCMKNQESLGLLPGGFNEATAFKKSENVMYIKNRKGFIKYSLQYGYELQPCYVFGECETYHNLFHVTNDNSIVHSIQQWLNRKDIPTVFPIGGHWFSPFLPFSNTGIHMVFSVNTQRLKKVENPTQQQIDELHSWYIQEMLALFDRNKWRFGYDESVQLKVV